MSALSVSFKTRLHNATRRVDMILAEASLDKDVSDRDRKILKVIEKHNDNAMRRCYELSRVDDDLEDFDECPNCGTIVHDGPCVMADGMADDDDPGGAFDPKYGVTAADLFGKDSPEAKEEAGNAA